jgi:hypothetical protein
VKWVRTNGGPYIVLAHEHRAGWEGADPPTGGRVVHAKFRWDEESNAATDYDEACDRTAAPDWFGPVKRRAFTALALPRGELTWVPRPDGAILVHCDTSPSPRHAATVVRTTLGPKSRVEPVRWRRTRTLLKTSSGTFVACDGAYPGREQPRKMTLSLDLGPGTYAVAVADYAPDAGTQMTLFRLTRKAAASRAS